MTNRLMCKSNLLDFTAEIERKSKKTGKSNYRSSEDSIQRPPEAQAGMLTSRTGTRRPMVHVITSKFSLGKWTKAK